MLIYELTSGIYLQAKLAIFDIICLIDQTYKLQELEEDQPGKIFGYQIIKIFIRTF
jgi:hypothetical protein